MAAWLLKMVNCLPKVRQKHREGDDGKGERTAEHTQRQHMGDFAQEHHLSQVGFSN